ncbi:MAG: hypothetical protein AAGD11_05265 [Planctomycetota bacterium]
MRAWLQTADDILRRAEWTVRLNSTLQVWLRMLVCLVFFGVFYGAVMGTFRGLTGQPQWLLQMTY